MNALSKQASFKPDFEPSRHFKGMMREIILLMADGKVRSLYEITAHVYRDDEDGGPITAENVVKVTLCHNRKKLRQLGWELDGRKGPGKYRLYPTKAAQK